MDEYMQRGSRFEYARCQKGRCLVVLEKRLEGEEGVFFCVYINVYATIYDDTDNFIIS